MKLLCLQQQRLLHSARQLLGRAPALKLEWRGDLRIVVVFTKSSILAFASSVKTRNHHRNSRSGPFRRSNWALFAGIITGLRNKTNTPCKTLCPRTAAWASRENLELGTTKLLCQHLITPQRRAATCHLTWTAKGARTSSNWNNHSLQKLIYLYFLFLFICIHIILHDD